jgi:predicted DNA-binding transcriptional regulator YafY
MRYDKVHAITHRHGRLIKLIRKGTFSARTLANKLAVSEQTIYRDIDSLRKRGYVIESHRRTDHWAYLLIAHRPLEKGA